MSIGFKIVIEDLAKDALSQTKSTIIPTAIHRVMRYFTLIQLRCYQLYSCPPQGLWREMHLLYSYAKSHTFLRYEVTDENMSKSSIKHTITETYEHAILLYATDPYQWRQNEQEYINNALDTWTPFASIDSVTIASPKSSGVYIIDLEQDIPPSPLADLEPFGTK